MLTGGALTVSRDWDWSRGLEGEFIFATSLSVYEHFSWGAGEGPVLTFIVASEDTAIVSNQRSPTYLFIRLLLVPAP